MLRLMQEKELKIVGAFFTAVTLKYVILLWIANPMVYTIVFWFLHKASVLSLLYACFTKLSYCALIKLYWDTTNML